MATYDGKYGNKDCADCGDPATEYLGRRLQGPAGRTHLYTCKGCADYRLGKNVNPKKIPNEESAPKPTRTAIFMQGHDGPKYTQGSLFDE